jgi:predicted RNA binding protein YcfA (HicA-like mRNA interferase family)
VKLPRDLSGRELALRLAALGYRPSRQSGSHLRLTSREQGEHHITIPLHPRLKPGTLSGIAEAVARHLGLDKNDLLRRLFDGRSQDRAPAGTDGAVRTA